MSKARNTEIFAELIGHMERGALPSGAVIAHPEAAELRALDTHTSTPVTRRGPVPRLPGSRPAHADTLDWALRQQDEPQQGEPGGPVTVLNFASAGRPGGGVQGGSSAQEEECCRQSTLYPSLVAASQGAGAAFYVGGAGARLALVSRVQVLRRAGHWLHAPRNVTVITCAAPNMRVWTGTPESGAQELEARMRGVLRLARDLEDPAGPGHLVLGAWGCGVFAHDPARCARSWAQAWAEVSEEAPLSSAVHWAVYDTSPGQATLKAFEGQHLGQTA